MTESLVIEILSEVFYTTFLVLLPILGLSLVVGVAISIFQAATSIQEMTLTFVPKILVTALAIIFFMPWILDKVVSQAIRIFTMISTVIK
jgi:flagellar biosynthetic protein FliQ